MKIVDAHIHLGLKEFCLDSIPDFQYNLCCTCDEALALMDKNNIRKAVALPIPHRQFDSRKSNDYVLEAFGRYPDRFVPFCRIDENLEENLFVRGFRGVKLHLLYEDFDIKKDKKYLQLIEDANVPLLIHAKFNNKVKQIEEILKYAPNLTIILAHMGRGHLYTAEQIVDNAIGLKKYSNIYVDSSTVGDVKGIINCVEILGDERVLYGSDYPFGREYYGDKYNYKDDISMIEQVFTKQQSEKILYQNIERILKRSEPEQLQIRRAKKADVEEVFSILNMLSDQDKKFLAFQNKKSLIRQTIRNERHCYVACVDGKIVGFMRESGRPQSYSLLEEIAIDPKFRGRGIAKKMLEYYHNAFPKTMAKTNSHNSIMIHLLSHNGYIPENQDAPRIINWERKADD